MTRGTREKVDPGTTAVVVGGGLAGVAAAAVLAERGVLVTLLERSAELGGRLGAWADALDDGTRFQMSRGVRGIGRHYYNFRELVRRVDPRLERLQTLGTPDVLGSGSRYETLSNLPTTPPLNIMALLRRTPSWTLESLRKMDRSRAEQLLSFDISKTYDAVDGTSAKDYLDALRLPERTRRLVFDVIAQGSHFREEDLSAAELAMRFHFYFLANPEGLAVDLFDEPVSDAFWKPFERYLVSKGVQIGFGREAKRISRDRGDGWRVETDGEPLEVDALVLATDVDGLQSVFRESPDLTEDAALLASVEGLDVGRPTLVGRIFLAGPPLPERSALVRVMDGGGLAHIAILERIEGESRRWSLRTGGSVLELRGNASACEDSPAQRDRLVAAACRLYPELAAVDIVEERWVTSVIEPGFRPGSHACRPRVSTPYGSLVLAGDFARLGFPAAAMERCVASGMLAANHLLDRWDVKGEALHSVAPRGFMRML